MVALSPAATRNRAQNMRLARSVSLAAADVIGLTTAVATLSVVFPGLHLHMPVLALPALAWLPVGSVVHELHGGHDIHLAPSTVDEIPRILAWAVGSVVLNELLGHSMSVLAVLVLVVTSFVLTGLVRGAIAAAWRRFVGPERVVLIGSERVLARFRRKLQLERTANVEFVACIDPSETQGLLDPAELLNAASHVVFEMNCHRIVVASEDVTGGQLRAITDVGRLAQLKITILPATNGAIGSRARLRQFGELSMLEFHCRPMSSVAAGAKRVLDVVVGAALLCIALPVFAVIAIAIRLSDGGPVLFRQARGGRDGRPFTMLKFRTMVADAEARLSESVDLAALPAPMYKLQVDPRVTRVGRFLRRTSLDELPQLINVLRGEMSLVGPRPEDVRLVQQYDADALAVRCGMKPGITGPMQVHGRGDLTFSERLDLEREYMENYTLVNDLRILALTATTLMFGQRGAY
jgi:exopolysaccharide biosynthesis polyprenyl glycosylphosphotransferase